MRLVLLLFALSITFPVFSQKSMEQLSTDEEVLTFVRNMALRHHLYWNALSYDQLALHRQRGYSPEDLSFGETISSTRWLLHDFNGDGKKDLIFNGRLTRLENAVVAFISTGDTLMHKMVSSHFDIFPHSIALLGKNGLPLLEYGRIRNMIDKNWRESYVMDTLIFKFDDFIEYQPATDATLKFDSLTYRATSPWTGDRTPFIRIYANGQFQYTMPRFVKEENHTFIVQDTFTSTLTPAQVEELQQLLRAVTFYSLADNYKLENVYDMATARTTVYFNNGTSKGIRDYGMEGTLGLRLLYRRIKQLKDQARWELAGTVRQ